MSSIASREKVSLMNNRAAGIPVGVAERRRLTMRSVSRRTFGFALIVPLILFTVSLVGCGGGGGGEGPAIAREPLGTITGVVTGSGPIEGAKVSTDVGEHITITDAQGMYTLTVAPGVYTLIVHSNGYMTATVEDVWVVENQTVPADVEIGPPLEPGELTYVGSLRCKLCHNELFQTWKGTAHATSLKTDEDFIVPVVEEQFENGFDLSADSSFDAYTPAPVLDYDSSTGEYTVTIGEIAYPVHRTYGGDRGWKQRYMTRIGNSYYILPIQYNEVTDDWVTYHPDDWY
ncbi:MAG: carboxypeptidase regulatory-like domain-containing protein, partial [Candidatus Hydrogenedentes bacterium]|nr:carboxypeptidase regulatory-like domain-containing protein [Candidatus Hydrogenedentota bacterium]